MTIALIRLFIVLQHDVRMFIYDRTNFADVFLKASVCYIVSRPFCANVASKMECSLESACCLFGDGLVCL